MKVCGVDLGGAVDTIYFEGQQWEVPHSVEGWMQLDDQLPADCEIVYEGRCAGLEAVLSERALYSIDPGRSAQVMRALEEATDDRRAARTLSQLRQLRPELFQAVEPREPALQRLRDGERVRRSLVEQRTRVVQQLKAVRSQGKQKQSVWLQGFVGTPYEALTQVLLALDQSIHRVEAELKEQGERVVECRLLRTIRGMGPNLSAEITGEMDAFRHTETPEQAQSYGGSAPVTLSSGKKQWVRARRRCNHRARNALYLFAFCSMRFHAWARAYYDACRARGMHHSKALIALSNRWVPILFQMVKNNEPYDPSRKAVCVQ
jgi:transposase